MRRFRPGKDCPTIALALVALVAAAGVRAQDEDPIFRITNVEGSLRIGGLMDRLDTQSTQLNSTVEESSRVTQSDLRTSLFINTRSYVIHPNFLNFEVGGGPVVQRTASGTGSNDYAATRALYDLSARAEILRGKPYWGHIFYDHLNPTVSISPGDVLLTESSRYGFDVSLLGGVFPVGIELDAFNAHTQGRSAERRQDDRIEQMNFRAFRQFSPTSYSRLSLRASRQASSSGSAFLPILDSRNTSYDLNLDNQARFGASSQWLLINPSSFSDQTYRISGGQEVNTQTWRSTFDLRGEHSSNNSLRSSLRSDFSGIQQDNSRLSSQALGGGIAYLPAENLSTNLDLRGDRRHSTEVTGSGLQLDGSARYSVDFFAGRVAMGYTLKAGEQDQVAHASVAPVRGESITLTGLTPVSLSRKNVAAGSVVVSNSTRTQVYVEGMDYELTIVGTETRLARLAAGLISSGESVLVDYSYDVGGSYKYRQIDNAVDLSWNPNSYSRVGLRYLDSQQRLVSGVPTAPLNNIKDFSAMAQADVPFVFQVDMMVGGMLEWENRREDILPYRRRLGQAYYQTQLPIINWAGIRIGGRKSQTDYTNPTAVDANVTAWDASLWARPWYGIELFLTFNGERDTGPAIPRRSESTSARANWRYRQLSLSLSAFYLKEVQGVYSRRRSHGEFQLRRDF